MRVHLRRSRRRRLGIRPGLAQDFARQSELDALKDIAASRRQQTEILHRQAQRDSERAWREENVRVNAQRDARSARRFDRRRRAPHHAPRGLVGHVQERVVSRGWIFRGT